MSKQMPNPKQCELIITSNDLLSLKVFELQQKDQCYTIAINLQKIKKITLLEKSVLVIQFQNGELCLDLTKKELEKIKYEE